MEFVFKRTDQLSAEEKRQLCALFGRVFNKNMALGEFDNKYAGSVMNYSYHGLMADNGTIVGGYSAIPFKYRFFGKDHMFALSVDTMIDEKYRGDPFALKKMANMVYDALKRDGIPFVFGFPNENVYLIRKKVLKWEDVGELDYYILPVRIGAVARRLRIFNVVSGIFARLINLVPGEVDRRIRAEGAECAVEKVNDQEFVKYRYAGGYKIIKFNGGPYFAYKVFLEDNVRTAYLVDVFPLQKELVERAVRYIFESEGANIDVILYVGKLRSSPLNLFRAPKKIEPRKMRMAGRILIDSMIDRRVFDINNWNVNLSNFDVR